MPRVMNCAKRLSFGRRSCCGQMTKASPTGIHCWNLTNTSRHCLPCPTEKHLTHACESGRLNTSTLASPPGNTPGTGSLFGLRLLGKQHWHVASNAPYTSKPCVCKVYATDMDCVDWQEPGHRFACSWLGDAWALDICGPLRTAATVAPG